MKLESSLPSRSGFLHIAPLVDASLILLVFFLLRSEFIVHSGVPVSLPSARSSLTETVYDAHILRVSAGPGSRIFLNGREVRLNDLSERLKAENKKQSQAAVVVQADVLTTHGVVMELSNIVLSEGYEVIMGSLPQ